VRSTLAIGLRCALLGSLALTGTLESQAIVIRHDRDDARYLELGARFDTVVGIGRAHGTLIRPDWVATAAHVADSISTVSGTVRVGDRDYPIARIVYDPSWVGDDVPLIVGGETSNGSDRSSDEVPNETNFG